MRAPVLRLHHDELIVDSFAGGDGGGPMKRCPPVRLEQWSVRLRSRSPFHAPELAEECLSGIAHGHPRRPEPHAVTTSRVVRSRGRVITTESGTRYLLGEVAPEYARWCAEHGKPIDQKRPIRIRRAKAAAEATPVCGSKSPQGGRHP